MVGAVAMESVVEDYGHQQQYKKNRCDSDESGSRPRAITSYFSPLRRQQEDDGAEVAVLAVPRPADLLGYFPRVERTLPAEDKGGGADGKTLTNAARKTRGERGNKKDDVEESEKEKRQSEGARKRLFKKKSAASGSAGGSGSTDQAVTHSPTLDTVLLLSDSSSSQSDDLKPIESLAASVEMAKPAEVKRRSVDVKAIHCSPRRRSESLGESSCGDAADTSVPNTSTEVNVSSLSAEHEGPVTISYEEFIDSCHHADEGGGRGNAPDAEAAGVRPSTSCESSDGESGGVSGETTPPPIQTPPPGRRGASPALLTVSVEVHSSPEHEALVAPRGNPVAQKRVANIFNLTKTREKRSDADLAARKPRASKRSALSRRQRKALKSHSAASGTQALPNKPADDPESKSGAFPATRAAAATLPRWRSNVAVLLDDELLELDASGLPVVPACGKAERREFMAAFAKPGGKPQNGGAGDEKTSPASDGGARHGRPAKCAAGAGRTSKKRWRRGDARSPECDDDEEAAASPAKGDEGLKSATCTGRKAAVSPPARRQELAGRGARGKIKKTVDREVLAGGDGAQADEQAVEENAPASEAVIDCKRRKENEVLASVGGADETERQGVPARSKRSGRRSGTDTRDEKHADLANPPSESPAIRPRTKQSDGNKTDVSQPAGDAVSPKRSQRSQGRRLNFDGEGRLDKAAPATGSGETGEVGQRGRDASVLGVYCSELLSPHGPIMLKLTRVSSGNVEMGSSDEELFTPRSSKLNRRLKKQMCEVPEMEEDEEKKAAVVETRDTLRRSCRQKSSRPTVVEEEDDEEDEDGGRGDARRRVAVRGVGRRSINDVLGKVATSKPGRRPRHATALGKGASVNPSRKKSAKSETSHGHEICIVDDDSSSECSSDGEMSRSRREFLQSGLPNTLLRQRAREATALDVYAAAFGAFPTTTHVQQRELGCELWSLPFPTSGPLRTLAGRGAMPAVHTGTPGGQVPVLELGMCTWAKLSAARGLSRHQCGTWPPVADATRQALLADVMVVHPKFPAQRFLAQMRARNAAATSATSDVGAGSAKEPVVVEETGGSRQRKRKADDTSGAQRPKKRRGQADTQAHADGQTVLVISDDGSDKPLTAATEGSVSRRRGRQERSVTAAVQVDGRRDFDKSQAEAAQASALLGEVCDDLLWTEKYQPRSKDEIIGNASAVRKLHGWLKEWKSRANREAERASRREKTESQVKTSKGSGSDSDFQSESGDTSSSSEDDDSLCHGMLLTGPPGVGKTAAVYACAQELGFKVFEVNCSSQRSGRHILAQLREATQSHQVSKQRVSAHGAVLRAPATASSLAAGDARAASKQQGASARHASPVKVLRSPRKRPLSPRGSAATAAKKNQLQVAFSNFFKVNPAKGSEGSDKEPAEKIPGRDPKQSKRAEAKSQRADPAGVAVAAKAHRGAGCLAAGSQRTEHAAATSLILFEEVDVVFDDDTGFLSAIRTFMATTKRPIVLTTSDPTFYLTFDGHYEKIIFKTPSMASVVPYLRVACVAEGLHVSAGDAAALLAHVRGDVRRALLSLQLWARGGGAAVSGARPRILAGSDEGAVCEAVPAHVALCETRCAESLLGLSEALGGHGSLYSLLTEEGESTGSLERQLDALTQTQRLGLDFVRCNWELLLPLPMSRCRVARDLPSGALPATTTAGKGIVPEQGTRSKPELEFDDNSSPAKPLHGGSGRRRRREPLFFDSDVYDSEGSSRDAVHAPQNPDAANGDSESSDGTTGTQTGRRSPADAGGGEAVKRADGAGSSGRPGPAARPPGPEERRAARAALCCLDAVSQLADSLSRADLCPARFDGEAEGPCAAGLSDWWPAERKSGLLDASRVGGWDAGADTRDGLGAEIRAALEALALRRCRGGVLLALQSPDLGPEFEETLSLQVPESKEASRFLPESLEVARASEERRALARLVAPSFVALSSLCSRRAVATNYLPALRLVCRTERLREEAQSKRRFHHYLEEKLELSRSTLATLSADFP